MKKLFTSVVSLVTALTMLTACGGSESSGDKSETETTTTTTTAQTSQTDETTTTTAAPADSSSPDESSQTEPEQTSSITPMMWEVTGKNGAKITMVGAMHALKEDAYPLPKKITDAFEAADVLAVECDVTNITDNFALQLEQLKNMYYEGDDTLENHLDPEIYKGISDFATECGSSLALYNRCKPWVVVSLLEQLAMSQTELKADLGFDSKLTEMAKDAGKEIYELESVKMQTELLVSLPDNICEVMVADYARSRDEVVQEYEDTYTAWCDGNYDFFADGLDTEKVRQTAQEQGIEFTDEDAALLEEYNKLMLYDRNVGMRDKILQLLDGDKDIFLTVGAAHFAGDKGLVALLQAEGYTVTRVEY